MITLFYYLNDYTYFFIFEVIRDYRRDIRDQLSKKFKYMWKLGPVYGQNEHFTFIILLE